MRSNILGLALFMLIAFAVNAPVNAQTVEFKASIFTPPQNPLTRGMLKWAELIKEKSSGRIEIKVFSSSQMGPPPRQFDLARTGVADFSVVLHGLTPGRFPLSELAHVPGVLKANSNFGGAQALTSIAPVFAAEHPGVKIINMLVLKTALISKKEIKNAADLTGKRVRAAGSVQSDVLSAMGAVPVLIQPGEMSEALNKGMIDGASTAYSAVASFKLDDVAKFIAEGNMGLVTFATIMNQKSYDALPADLKKIIDENNGMASNIIFARLLEDDEIAIRETLIKQGIKIRSLEDDALLLKASGEILAQATAKASANGADVQKVLKKFENAAAKYGRQM